MCFKKRVAVLVFVHMQIHLLLIELLSVLFTFISVSESRLTVCVWSRWTTCWRWGTSQTPCVCLHTSSLSTTTWRSLNNSWIRARPEAYTALTTVCCEHFEPKVKQANRKSQLSVANHKYVHQFYTVCVCTCTHQLPTVSSAFIVDFLRYSFLWLFHIK